MNNKKFYKSRTLWVNGLTLLAVLLTAVDHNMQLDTEVSAWIIVVLTVVNMVLRMLTTTELEVPTFDKSR